MRKTALWIRRIVALAVFVAFVALFSGLEWRYVSRLAPLAKLQFAPAALAGNFVIAVAILFVTQIVGRIYCSVLCPLGLMQDVGGALGRVVRRIVRRPVGAAPSLAVRCAQAVVRHVVLVAVVVALALGMGFPWLEPYGIFGRAFVLWSGVAMASVIFLIAAAGRGRAWCGWVCPVGTFLGLLSRLSPFRPKIDASACVGCRKCERRCKAGAIAIAGRGEGGKVDASLCVDCLDCVAECPTGAIALGRIAKSHAPKEGQSGDGLTRKGFIVGTAAAGATLAAEASPDEKTVDGGFAEVTPPGVDTRNLPLRPAGSHSLAMFRIRCVACQLCVKACPNHVLRPSKRGKDFMQPEMAFDKGYCTVDCTKCGEVCPAGAIEAVPQSMKSKIHIGEAAWHKDRCIAATEGVNCTACFRHCPVGAITRIDGENGAKIPVIDVEKCIGCGACEHVCPSRPLPAMTVTAYERHCE